MKKIKIYLAGTIYNEEPGKSWKQRFIQELDSSLYEFFDPDPANEPEGYMVARDKAEITKCDIFVAYIERPSFGTAMEIMYTSILGTKPIMIINPNMTLYNDLWVSYHVDTICLNIEDCANHIKTMRF